MLRREIRFRLTANQFPPPQETHQWWELYDVKTSRFYYYNASTQVTNWKKPSHAAAIIIPLAKLQILKQSSNGGRATREVATQTKQSCMVLVNNSTQTTPPPSLRRGMCYATSEDSWNTKRSLRSYLINEARFAKGLDGLNDQEVLLMSDYDDFWDSAEDEEGSTSDQWDADDESGGEDDHEDEDDEDEDQERESESADTTDYDQVCAREEARNASMHDHSAHHHNRSSVFEPSIAHLKHTPSPPAHKSQSFTGGLLNNLKKEEQPQRTTAPQPSPPATKEVSAVLLRHEQRPELPPHREHHPIPPQRGLSLNYDATPSPPPTKAGNNGSVSSGVSPSSSLVAKPPKERKERSPKDLPPPPPPEYADSNGTTASNGVESSSASKSKSKKEKSTEAKAKSVATESKGNQIMEKFARENVARHIKRGVGNQLLKRKTSLKQMLSWSKNSIRQPMIATLMSNSTNRSDIKMEAIACFKLIQMYMGDRTDRKEPKSKDMIAFELIATACHRQDMRDEIYVQLCRQTTDNPRKESVRAGLELMAICLSYFPPSVKFSPYLASFLTNNPLKELQTPDKDDLIAIALINHCYHRLIKMRGIHLTEGGAVGGSGGTVYCRKPVTSKEIDMVCEAIQRGFPGIFGESLEALMVLQERRWPLKRYDKKNTIASILRSH